MRGAGGAPDTDRRRQRHVRRLVAVALAAWVLGTVHLADHVVRGELVVSRGLEPTWNHSGWPFQPELTPFTFSAVLVQLLVLGGIVLTLRGRLWARYWLGTGLVLGILVIFVHFVPGPRTETPAVIFRTYERGLDTAAGGLLGGVAVVLTLALVGAVILITRSAVHVGRQSRS